MHRVSIFFIAAAALLLSSCGFKPMHAPGAFGAASYDYSEISVVSLENEKIDFLLKQALRDRIGDNYNTKYILQVEPDLKRKVLGIGSDDVASRYDLTMKAKIILLDAKTGEELFKDKVTAISTFAAPRDPYGTVSAQNNATELVAVEAADRTLARLARYFANPEQP